MIPFLDSPQNLAATNLYNALTWYHEVYKGKIRMPGTFKEAIDQVIGLDEIETLDHIHTELDHAVLDAYGSHR